jgi:hypothetical protein
MAFGFAVGQASASPPEPTVAADDTVMAADSLKPAAMRTRLYLGMWSTHLRHLDEGVDGNSLLGIAYRGYFGATFINSWGDRALAAGVQRSFTRPQRGPLTTALGYRAGLVTGYDERFLSLAGKTPVLPFAQVVGSLDYRRIGVEVAYAGIVVSVTAN